MSRPPNERTAYSCTVANRTLAGFGVVAGAVLVAVFAFTPAHPVASLVGGVVVAVAVWEFSTIRLTAGPGGVTVRYGLFGFPRYHYPSDQIASARAEDLSFAQLGGLGMHWSPWRGTRLTVRPGPTLQLVLTSGGTVAISAADPKAAAAVLHRS